MITQGKLKKHLSYDPNTGVFVKLTSTNNRHKVGDIAGSLDYKWYTILRIAGDNYKSHRLAFLYMTGKFPKNQVDHINHIRNDNRWINLREVTHQENNRNLSKAKNNKSGVTGVCWNCKSNMWQSYISLMGKRIYLGLFKNKQDAINARKQTEIKYGFHTNHGVLN